MNWRARLVVKDSKGQSATDEDMIEIEQELNKLMVIGVNGKTFSVRFHIIGKEQGNGSRNSIDS